MVTVDGIINKGYEVDVFPDTFTGNRIPEGTGWVKKVDKCNNGSTKMSVKLDVDGFLYHNITLKGVSRVYILNIM